MEKKLDEVRFDTTQVGWYYVVEENEHLNQDAITLMGKYQNEGAFNIMLIYDKDEAKYGTSKPFRAYQITPEIKQLL